jgi:hypothetical protein
MMKDVHQIKYRPYTTAMTTRQVWWFPCADHEGLWESGGSAPLTLTSALRHRWSSASTGRFIPRGISQVSWVGAGVGRGGVGKEKSLALRESNRALSVVQPVACTDYSNKIIRNLVNGYA